MFDWVADLRDWMSSKYDAFLTFLNELIDAVLVELAGMMQSFLEWLKEWALELMAALELRAEQMGIDIDPQAVIDGLSDVGDFVDDIDWIFPVYEMVGIMAAGLGAAAGVRLVRYIIGWIPTVEG